jgi:hypothetical protein
MLLCKDGVTVDVAHPADIKRYKSVGYTEEKAPEETPAEPKLKGKGKAAKETPAEPKAEENKGGDE